MASINIRRAAVALGIALAAAGTTTGAAHAAELPASCNVDGHLSESQAHYVNSGAYHVWTSMSYKVSKGNLGPQNDMFWSIKVNGDTVYTGSDPDFVPNAWHNKANVSPVRTYGGNKEQVVFRTVFDTNLWDEECYSATQPI